VPRPPSGDAATEGTRLHDVAASLLTSGCNDCDPDDWEQVGAYVDEVRRQVGDSGDLLDVECDVLSSDLGISGTIDARTRSSTGRTITDLKTGHRPVEVFENRQLLVYAICDVDRGATKLVIVQPNGWHRDGPVRRWTVPDLAPYRADLVRVMDEARNSPRLVATPENCTYCAAVTSCEAARAVTLGGADMALKHTGLLPPEAIKSELVTLRTTLKLTQIRLDALEAEAEQRVRSGERIPGCGMRPGRGGSLAWSRDEAQIRAICGMVGVDPTRTKLITPTQAEKAGVPPELVASMSTRGPTGMVLSTDVAADAAELFADD
jgi:hypothetical protein